MRTLFLIRHAKSSWDNPGLRDVERPLNERGLREAPLMAQMLQKQGIVPDLIVSSHAKRAYTTALFFARVLGIEEDQILKKTEIYEASTTDIMRVVAELDDEAFIVCLFGHNPTFTDVANRFTEDYIENVPTCGIVRIESKANDWRAFYEGNSKVTACFFPKETL